MLEHELINIQMTYLFLYLENLPYRALPWNTVIGNSAFVAFSLPLTVLRTHLHPSVQFSKQITNLPRRTLPSDYGSRLTVPSSLAHCLPPSAPRAAPRRTRPGCRRTDDWK